MPPRLNEATEKRTFAVLVDNEPGVLARVVGLFSARGYNIESLTVAETDPSTRASRITIVTSGTALILEQIRAQLERMVSIRDVHDVSSDPLGIERELALLKVKGTGEQRAEALRLADIFRAKVVDTTHESFVFELTGGSSKIDQFIGLMQPLGLTEISRTGVLSITRGVD
jgi:acetolactate synthase-1/3 small subunit